VRDNGQSKRGQLGGDLCSHERDKPGCGTESLTLNRGRVSTLSLSRCLRLTESLVNGDPNQNRRGAESAILKNTPDRSLELKRGVARN